MGIYPTKLLVLRLTPKSPNNTFSEKSNIYYPLRRLIAGNTIFIESNIGEMGMKFNTKDLAAISLCAALWAILNLTIGPVFWNMTHLPVLCDMVGVSLLVLVTWWTRKLGAASLTGIIATVLNLALSPGSIHFLGFTAASIVFDIVMRLPGYGVSLDKGVKGAALTLATSLLSTLVAGVIIGTSFMAPAIISNAYGGVAFFALLHGAGGLVGGLLGIVFIRSLESRHVVPK